MATTLIITNDFPPRIGGIESFVADIAELLDRDVLVYASGPPGAARLTPTRGYPVVRAGELLLPTHRVAARAVDLVRQSGATGVIFGAAAPLGLLAPALRRAGAQRIVGITHGHETWWARLPGARVAAAPDRGRLRSPDRDLGVHRTADRPRPEPRGPVAAVAPAAPGGSLVLPAGRRRRPAGPAALRGGRPVRRPEGAHHLAPGLAAGAGPTARCGIDPPELVLVGDGPQRRRLQSMIDRDGLAGTVRLTGALTRAGVRSELQQAQVFALPVRTSAGRPESGGSRTGCPGGRRLWAAGDHRGFRRRARDGPRRRDRLRGARPMITGCSPTGSSCCSPTPTAAGPWAPTGRGVRARAILRRAGAGHPPPCAGAVRRPA